MAASSSSSISRTKSTSTNKDAVNVKNSIGGPPSAVTNATQVAKRRGTDSDGLDANVSSPDENIPDPQDSKERSSSSGRHGYSSYTKRSRHSGNSPNTSGEEKHHRRPQVSASAISSSSRSSGVSRSVKK